MKQNTFASTMWLTAHCELKCTLSSFEIDSLTSIQALLDWTYITSAWLAEHSQYK